MDTFTYEYYNEYLIYFSCYDEYDFVWQDDRSNIRLRATLDRILWD